MTFSCHSPMSCVCITKGDTDKMALETALTVFLTLIILFHGNESTSDGDECKVNFGNLSIPETAEEAVSHVQTQYIIADMNFTCNGSIAKWNVVANVPSRGPEEKSIDLQLWRVLGAHSDGTTSYSLATQQSFSVHRILSTSGSSATLEFSPSPEMLAFSGDIVGFYVPSVAHPLEVIFNADATSFMLYEVKSSLSEAAIVSDSSTASPLISVVFCTATPDNVADRASSQSQPLTHTSTVAETDPPTHSLPDPVCGQANADSTPTHTPMSTRGLRAGEFAGIVIAVLVLVAIVLAAIHVSIMIAIIWKQESKRRKLVADFGSVNGDLRTSLLNTDIGGDMAQRDERFLSATYENEVMGRNGRSRGGYYNLTSVKVVPARSGQSSNSSTLYHFVQSLESRGSAGGGLDCGDVYEELEAVYEEVTVPALEDQQFVEPPLQLEGVYGCLASRKCLEIPVEVLKTTTALGTGQFSEVWRGFIDTPSGEREVAVKRMKEGASQTEKVKFLQEAVVMKQFVHPNILRMVGVVTQTEPYMLVLEYAHKGDLREYLLGKRPDPGVLPDPCLRRQQLRFCREIANGMKYLSKKGFIHRDLAARNVLLDAKLKCKIADFGLSKNLDSEYYVSEGGMVPVKWTAPEGIFYKKYTTKSDVWSFGMVMYEIWSLGDKPFPDLTAQEVVKKLQADPQYVQPPPAGCPGDIYRLMVLCWNYNYNRRPGFDAILSTLFCLDEEEVAILDDVR